MFHTVSNSSSDSRVEDLPEWADRFLSVSEAASITGLAVSTVWQKVARRELPAPYKISANRTAWSFRELQDWIAERKQSGRLA